MKIELRQNVPSQAPSYTSLIVNGVELGEYIFGAEKKYLNPEKWAKEQIKKRNVVIDRNILRLESELATWKKERDAINETKR